MGHRCIYVRRGDYMSVEYDNLLIKNNDKKITIPLSDISMIYLEDNKAKISSSLLSGLAKNYVGLITSDEAFQPVSITLPLHIHYKQLKVFDTQMKLKKPVKKQLWSAIIKSKIDNQINALKYTNNDEFIIEKLSECSSQVQSGDKTNREALAAKLYFKSMFGENFVRDRKSSCPINASLNFGYTILSGMVSRILTMYGFNTILGLHHESMTNNFNLTYDIVEPFRPIIDMIVYENINSISYPLNKEIKYKLIDGLSRSIRIDNKKYKVENAIEVMVISLINSYENNDASLLLTPTIIQGGEIDVDDDI